MAQNKDLALSAAEARAIAKDAFIYGFPMAANYQTMHKQAIDTSSPDYRAPFNTLTNAKSVATPDDKFVVTPNSDTPYSYLWMDLRAEPLVVTMPAHRAQPLLHRPDDRSLHLQLRLPRHPRLRQRRRNLPHRRPRLERRPNHLTSKTVIHCETQFAYLLFRTQLFNAADLPNVNNIQAGYHAQPLSAFLNSPHPQPRPRSTGQSQPTSPHPRRPSSPSSTSSSSSARPIHPKALSSPASPNSTSAPTRPSTSPGSPPKSSKPSTTASRTPTPISTPS